MGVATTAMLIAGQDRMAIGGGEFLRFDPVTGDLATIATAGRAADAKMAVDAARDAFAGWSSIAPTERRRLLNGAADQLESRAADFAQAMLEEIGSTRLNAARNVMLGVASLREAASLTTRATGEVLPTDRTGCLSMGIRQPAGVVLAIAPWNAPVILGVRAISGPLACGNTVVLKASEICPKTHRLIGDIFRDAGFPPGVVNIVFNAPADAAEVVETLIAHPAVRRVNFTGSSKVGRRIAELSAMHLKPALLELGGKSPLVVLADADLDQAVGAASFGAFSNQGQICMSTERIIVLDEIADVFVDKFAARAASIQVGDPRDPSNTLGGLIGPEAVDRIWRLIEDATDKGATRVCGGRLQGAFISPTVIDHVGSDMDLYHEETFGPVAAIIRARDVEAAIAIANDSEYGLSAAVFGKDIGQALSVARRIESGACHINGSTVHNEAQAPFGGTKASGYGRFGGESDIAEFTDLRWITISTVDAVYPF